ncbi:MAG TPA: hypothetical protein H9667_07285 [Firmicutes bacterium]|nr:hypothetical protein [Bacillota bacterium]
MLLYKIAKNKFKFVRDWAYLNKHLAGENMESGYPFPMLATELFTKERKGMDNQNSKDFPTRCSQLNNFFERESIKTCPIGFVPVKPLLTRLIELLMRNIRA